MNLSAESSDNQNASHDPKAYDKPSPPIPVTSRKLYDKDRHQSCADGKPGIACLYTTVLSADSISGSASYSLFVHQIRSLQHYQNHHSTLLDRRLEKVMRL